jgi:hypothetical protein
MAQSYADLLMSSGMPAGLARVVAGSYEALEQRIESLEARVPPEDGAAGAAAYVAALEEGLALEDAHELPGEPPGEPEGDDPPPGRSSRTRR